MDEFDVQVMNQGTLIGFRPMTEAGKDWFTEHVVAPDYMLMHDIIWADHRMAQPIIDGGEAAGLVFN